MKHYDYLVVGAGLFGACFAQKAQSAGRSVLVVEKREHIGGNVYTEEIEGIQVHKYGAHIFHTDSRDVWDYVNQFAQFSHYIHSPAACYHGKMYSLPFNMNTFHQMWNIDTPEEAREIINKQRQAAGISEPKNLEEQAICMVGTDIYEKLVKGYTQKQWGRDCSELPAFIIRRLPLRFVYDNDYFDSRYQGIPRNGYTAMISDMLRGIDVILNQDYLKNREELNRIADKIIYTGPIDGYFDYCLGHLAYRSLRFETEILDTDDYQGRAVINYTDSETPWTRIIEHKHFSGDISPVTVITREYSCEYMTGAEPYYPINDEANNSLYKKYCDLASREDRVLFGGRLGGYRYYDMDKTLLSAFALAEKEL